MRSIALLKGFTQKELKETEELLSQKKRESLIKLFLALKPYIKKDKLPERRDLYKKAFGKTFTDKDSGTLNKELYLLNEVLYDQLALMTFKERMRKNETTRKRWIAQAYRKREMHDLMRQDIDGFIEHSKTDILPEETVQLMLLRLMFLRKHQQLKPAIAEKILGYIDDTESEVINYARQRIRHLEHYRAAELEVLTKVRLQYNNDKPVPSAPIREVIELEPEPQNWYEEFNMLLKRMHETKDGEERVTIWTRLIELAEHDRYESHISQRDRLRYKMSFADALMLSRRHEEAQIAMREVLREYEQLKLSPSGKNPFYNYLYNCIVIGSYQECIDFIESHRESVRSYTLYNLIILVESYAYVLSGRTKQGLSVVRGFSVTNPVENFSQRMIYILSALIEEQYEVAYNECINLKKMASTTGADFDQKSKLVTNLFYRYAKCCFSGESMEVLKRDMQQDYQRLYDLSLYSVSLLWLMKRLGIEKPEEAPKE